jgi:hypothetical protein
MRTKAFDGPTITPRCLSAIWATQAHGHDVSYKPTDPHIPTEPHIPPNPVFPSAVAQPVLDVLFQGDVVTVLGISASDGV